MESRILEEVRSKSLASILPGFSELILEKGEVRLLAPEQIVFHEGESPSHYIMPVSEHIRLFTPGADGSDRLVGYVQKHRSVGLRELMENRSYAYSAATETATSLLFVPRRDFLDLLNLHPRISHYLMMMTQSAALRGFKTFLTERGLLQEQIFDIFALMPTRKVEVEKGAEIKRTLESILFIRSGRVRIDLPAEEGSETSIELGEGAFFGAQALVSPFRLDYQATAVEHTVFHSLPLKDFSSIAARCRLTEVLFDEPWFPKDLESSEEVGGELAVLPGMPLTETECLALSIPLLDPSRFKRAVSDRSSFVASLSNVATLKGIAFNIGSAETEFQMVRNVNALALSEIGEPYGLYFRELKCRVDELSRQRLPALCMFGTRMCGLLAIRNKDAFLLDPAKGAVRVPLVDFAPHWEGTILEVSHAEVEGGAKAAFFGAIGKFKPTLTNVVLLSLGAFGLNLLIPLFSQHILDEVLSLGDRRMLITCVAGLVLTTFFNVAVMVAKQLALSEFSFRYDHRISAYFYRKALALPGHFFHTRKVGEILARIAEIWIIRDFLSGQSLQSITDVFSILVYAGVLCFYSWKIALVPLALFVVVAALRFLTKDSFQRKHTESFDADTRSKSIMSEQIGAIGTIKALGAERVFSKRWEEAFLTRIRLFTRLQNHSVAVQTTVSFLAQATRLCGIWIAADLALNHEFSAGEILAISMYLDGVIAPVSSIASIFSQIERVKVAFQKIGEIMDANSEQSSGRAMLTHSPILNGKIKLDRVSFRYKDGSPWAVRDLDLTIYPKQVIAIVGRSGCGKTTLANLIAGNIRPTTGRIIFDDFDSTFLSLSSIRKQTGFIMQAAELFSGSIGENIAYSDTSPIDEDVEHSAIEGNAAEFIAKFPAGYKHFLGEGGLGLSGGQKQRLSISRTLYRKPKILILDEATSALDAESEKRILENMREILKGKTAVIIAHRLSTIRSADRIFVMKDGHVVEEGNHADLLKKGGHYAELFESQVSVGDA